MQREIFACYNGQGGRLLASRNGPEGAVTLGHVPTQPDAPGTILGPPLSAAELKRLVEYLGKKDLERAPLSVCSDRDWLVYCLPHAPTPGQCAFNFVRREKGSGGTLLRLLLNTRETARLRNHLQRCCDDGKRPKGLPARFGL